MIADCRYYRTINKLTIIILNYIDVLDMQILYNRATTKIYIVKNLKKKLFCWQVPRQLGFWRDATSMLSYNKGHRLIYHKILLANESRK